MLQILSQHTMLLVLLVFLLLFHRTKRPALPYPTQENLAVPKPLQAYRLLTYPYLFPFIQSGRKIRESRGGRAQWLKEWRDYKKFK